MRRRLLLAWLLAGCASPGDGALSQEVTSGAADQGDPAVIALIDAADHTGCTASVIAPHTAITAAHCIAGIDPRTLRVAFGSSVDTAAAKIAVADGRMHPSFDAAVLGHDLALLTLREAAPAPALALDPGPVAVGASIRVVGFGSTGAGLADTGTKRAGSARITAVNVDELDVVPDPSQPCRGDSGGPALLAAGTIGGVVSRGDTACADHATYARVDVARTVFIDPYLAETAAGTAATGDACFYDGHCAEGACLQTLDDPLLFFCSRACSRDGDCPAAMRCADDGCRYPEPSPGALGSTCTDDKDCTTALCRDQVCTISCIAAACPDGFACTGDGLDRTCAARPDGCGGCATGGGGGSALLVLIALGRARRTARSAAPRGSRAARAR